jgi:DNA-binding GntR family transcriptional regulator
MHSEFTMHPKIRPLGTLDRAYEEIKRSIVEGAYKPGQRLKALRVAGELKISRTPVKEALARLEQEGLVRREPGSGFVVRGLSILDILISIGSARRSRSRLCARQCRTSQMRAGAACGPRSMRQTFF